MAREELRPAAWSARRKRGERGGLDRSGRLVCGRRRELRTCGCAQRRERDREGKGPGALRGSGATSGVRHADGTERSPQASSRGGVGARGAAAAWATLPPVVAPSCDLPPGCRPSAGAIPERRTRGHGADGLRPFRARGTSDHATSVSVQCDEWRVRGATAGSRNARARHAAARRRRQVAARGRRGADERPAPWDDRGSRVCATPRRPGSPRGVPRA
jgi:hypothetical protein